MIWCSNDAFIDLNEINPSPSWCEDQACLQPNFVDIVFETQEDRGILGTKLISPNSANQNQVACDFTDVNQYFIDDY